MTCKQFQTQTFIHGFDSIVVKGVELKIKKTKESQA